MPVTLLRGNPDPLVLYILSQTSLMSRGGDVLLPKACMLQLRSSVQGHLLTSPYCGDVV